MFCLLSSETYKSHYLAVIPCDFRASLLWMLSLLQQLLSDFLNFFVDKNYLDLILQPFNSCCFGGIKKIKPFFRMSS